MCSGQLDWLRLGGAAAGEDLGEQKMTTSVLDVLEFPESLAALDELSVLLSCSCCRGKPGAAPVLLDGCGHSICKECRRKSEEDSGSDDEGGEDTDEDEGWAGGSCPVTGCGVNTTRAGARVDRIRLERWEAVKKMQRAITGEEEKAQATAREDPPTKKMSAPEKTQPSSSAKGGRGRGRTKRSLSPLSASTSAASSSMNQTRAKRKPGGKFFKRSSSPTSSTKSETSTKSAGAATPAQTAKKSSIKSSTKSETSTKSAKGERGKVATPAQTAKKSSTKSLIQNLVKSKMKPPQKSPMVKLDRKNAKGETALQKACIRGDLELVRDLLSRGASANTCDNAGWTPLHEAVMGGHTEVARLLLDDGRADPNVPGSDENLTPLHEATTAGHRGLIKLLVAKGADKNAKDATGKTPRDVASDAAALSCLDSARCLLTDSEQLDLTAASAASAAAHELQQRRVLYFPDVPASESSAAKTAAKRMGAKVDSALAPEVTTVVFFGVDPKDGQFLEKETSAYYECMLAGKWLVGKDWLDASADEVEPLPEEDYVLLGVSDDSEKKSRGTTGAPGRAAENALRLRRPPLFDGCHFYLQGAFSSSCPLSKPELGRILRAGGGAVLTREPDPEAIPDDEQRVPYHAEEGGPLAKCSHYLVYLDGVEGIKEPQLKYNMAHMKSLPLSWLLACIREFRLLNPKRN